VSNVLIECPTSLTEKRSEMALMKFKQFHKREAPLSEDAYSPSLSKLFDINQDGMEIHINIVLTKHEQHLQVVQFLYRVAEELTAIEKALRV
jgi:hypothetical protein